MLKCVVCGKIIVLNDKPVHYGVCSSCSIKELTEEQKKIVQKCGYLDSIGYPTDSNYNKGSE